MAKCAALAFALLAVAGCGRRGSSAAPVEKKDAIAGISDTAPEVEISPKQLGLADLAAFQWRKRPGQPLFRKARAAEAKDDWPGVVDLCRQVLAADPGHLEAAWLLAVGLAKVGKLDEVLPPLHLAVAGDLGKWGQASLDQPALQPFLATAVGQAWRRRVEEDRGKLAAALGHAIVVVAHGDLFAFDPEANRWYRLTRTSGAVIGVLDAPAVHQLAYVTRSKHKVRLGTVDLSTLKTLRPVETGLDKAQLVYGTGNLAGFWIGSGTTWREIDADGKLHALPAGTKRPPGPWLDILGHSARLHRLPVSGVAADWDDQSLASAIKLATTNRVITAPSVGLIDGNTVAWSPDHTQLAFVTVDDHCTPGSDASVAFVADAATGTAQELERAKAGLAVEWLADKKLAVAGDHGVTIVDTGTGQKSALADATGLVSPRRQPRCTPEVPDENPLEPEEDPADAPESVSGAAVDAGVDASR